MVLGVSWALLGASVSLFERSNASFFQTWVPDGLQNAFWIDLGSILIGFGLHFGRGGKGLEGFERFGAKRGQILQAFGKMWPCCD